MVIDKVLIFDLKGEYAHFKKYYTTTSPLTFSVPPKTVIYGIVGAILGFSKEMQDDDYYLNYFQDKSCLIGVEILEPIRKTRITLNLIDTKKAVLMARIKNRTQIRTEYIVNPHYRLYFYHQNKEVYQQLKKNLEKHRSYYTISLGLSENLANYIYQGEMDLQVNDNNQDMVPINTVIPVDEKVIKKGDIDFSQAGCEYFSEKVALEMKPDREVVKYSDILFEKNANTVIARVNKYYQLPGNKNIVLF